MPLMRIMAVLVVGLHVLLAGIAGAARPLEVHDISSAEFIAIHALLLGCVLFAISILVCGLFIRTWKDARAILTGITVPFVIGIAVYLAGRMATDVLGYSNAKAFSPVITAFGFTLAIGASVMAILLMQSKLAEKVGDSRADWEIGPVRPPVFWLFLITMALNVCADALWLKEIAGRPVVAGALVCTSMIVWLIADYADNKFKELMAA